MFFADASGGALFPAPRHVNAPEQPRTYRPAVRTVVIAIAIGAVATVATWATLRSGATVERAPITPTGPVVADTSESTGPDILDGHTPASQMLLTSDNGGSPR